MRLIGMYNFITSNNILKGLVFIKILWLLGGVHTLCAQERQKEQSIDNIYFQEFQNIFHRIEQTYIQEPNRREMINEAINGMLRSLDPYSGYFTDDDFDFFVSQTDGEFGGIGVEIIPDEGVIKVITPIDDLPAYKAGIRAKDYIVGINGQLVSNLGFNKAVQQMRGAPGTKLNLLMLKSDKNETEELELKRTIIKIQPIKYEIEEDTVGGIGYIRIVAFNHKTSTDLKNAIIDITKKLAVKKKSLKGIILDLRNNPGGLFNEATAVSEYFIQRGMIVSVKGRSNNEEFMASTGNVIQKAPDLPMVALINSGTASAAEIVAGALQDHKRAIILGTTSYGKGVVQVFTQIGKRQAIKITTAKYYTPHGKSINGKGIEPDIYIENEKVEFIDKASNRKFFTNSSIKSYLQKYNSSDIIDQVSKIDEHKISQKYKEDYQYARAYDLIRGLIINRLHNPNI